MEHNQPEIGNIVAEATFFDRQLFSRNSPDAKDYSIYYKYRTEIMDGQVSVISLNSTAVS